MISVNRKSIAAPSVLTEPKARGVKEQQRIARFYEGIGFQRPNPDDPAQGKPPKASVYSDAEVVKALTVLFRGKCAYCESRFVATQPVDVEHFRPKAGVAGDAVHPGYYWLGADWENLLPSCIDCNRAREQETAAAGMALPVARLLGKAMQFPLLNPATRARRPTDDLMAEEPGLLNPCSDNPSQFLSFTEEGVVVPAESGASPTRTRAELSIEVYALNRSGLVLARLETLGLLEARILTINRLANLLDSPQLDAKVADVVEVVLAYEMNQLRQFADPGHPYSQMCAQRIAVFMERFG